MISIFLISIICGSVMIFLSIKDMLMLKKINKYMQVIDITLPSVKADEKWYFSYFIKNKFFAYFDSVYERGGKLKVRGSIIVIASVVILYIGNYLFLRLPNIIVLVVAVFVGGYIAKRVDIRNRRLEFEKSFPQALIILNGALSSGGNIIQALSDCSRSIDGILSNELNLIVRSLSIGEEPANIFANSYERMPFKNYYFFLIAILVSMKSGAKLKEILSRLSSATTKAKTMEKKKLALTSEARMSAKITAAIPFCFLVLMRFISPDNFNYILTDPTGRWILYYFLASEFTGMLIIMFLMRKI